MIRQMFQLQFMIEKWTPDLLTLFTIFYAVSAHAIASQRPKCVNLAPAGAKAYETFGNRRVNKCNNIIYPQNLGLHFCSSIFASGV